MGRADGAARHVPAYARALMARYEDEMRALRDGGAAPPGGKRRGPVDELVAWLALMGLLI